MIEERSTKGRSPWPLLRGGLAALLLALEVWFFKERFRTDALEGKPYAWAELVRAARFNVPWVAAILTTLCLLGWSRLRAAFAAERAELCAPRRTAPFLAAHGAALLAFFATSRVLLDEPPERAELSFLWPLAWLAAALLLLAALAGFVLAPRPLARVLRANAGLLAQSLVAGSAIFLLAAWVMERWPLWEPLALGTLHVAAFLIGLFTDELVYEPAELMVGTPDFPVIVTKYCSGYEGISLFAVFFASFLFLCRDRLRFPRALLLLPLGTALVWLLNAVRIALLIAVGELVSHEVAIEGFHENAGWTLVSVVALGLVAVSTRVPFFAARLPATRASGEINPTAAYVGPLLAVVATEFLLGSFTTVPEAQYPFRVLAALLVLSVYKREYRELRPGWSFAPWLAAVVAFGLWIAALPAAPGRDPLAWQATTPETWVPLWWFFRLLGSLAVAPVVEELAFRGYLTRRLIRADFESVAPGTFTWPSFLLSSLAFGVLHQSLAGVGILVGMLYALVYYRRGRLFDAVLAHALTNAFLFLYALATGRWDLWL